jgi:hypothetical protein
MNYNDHCEGCCTSFNSQDESCQLSKHNDSGQCPCSTCIVKVMCEKSCDDFDEFRKDKP